MKHNKSFRHAVMGIMALLLISFSTNAFAGKILLREKLEKKINESSNIQFQRNNEESQNSQYEPYYFNDQTVQQENAANRPEPNRLANGQQIANYQNDASANYNNPTQSKYAVYQTSYKAELEDNVVTVKGKAIFEVFEGGWTQIPLIGTDVGLIDVSMNKGVAFVTMQGNKYMIMTDRPGRYTLNFEFLIKAQRERENGPGNFDFDVIPAPISQYEFTMTDNGVQVFVEPAIRVEVEEKGEKTIAWAVMPNTRNIKTRWTKALPKEEIQRVKLDPKIYAKTATYASVGEGIVRCNSEINLSILQSETSTFRILLAKDTSLLDVSGQDIRDWKITQEDGNDYLDIYLTFGVKGNYVLNLTYEKNIGQGSVVADIPQIKVMGVERENGHLGIASKTNVELAVNNLINATVIDTKELPSSIWRSSSNPILLAFKYLNHPFGVTIDVTRHEELPVLISAIDLADYQTVHTEEGKALTSVTYQVRNNVKQFLRIGLPDGATLWSAFVAGKPVKPAKDKGNTILIPLEKSKLQGESLTHFPVEIVYLDKSVAVKTMGKIQLSLPKTDIPVSELLWSLYMPEDYTYYGFKGDVKNTKYFQTQNIQLEYLGGGSRRDGRSRSQSMMEQTSQYEPYYLDSVKSKSVAVPQKLQTSVQQAGAMPIRVNIPKQGRILHFTKLLVTDNESPSLKFKYVKAYRKAQGIIKIIAFIVFILLGIRFIVKFFKRKKRKKMES